MYWYWENMQICLEIMVYPQFQFIWISSWQCRACAMDLVPFSLGLQPSAVQSIGCQYEKNPWNTQEVMAISLICPTPLPYRLKATPISCCTPNPVAVGKTFRLLQGPQNGRGRAISWLELEWQLPQALSKLIHPFLLHVFKQLCPLTYPFVFFTTKSKPFSSATQLSYQNNAWVGVSTTAATCHNDWCSGSRHRDCIRVWWRNGYSSLSLILRCIMSRFTWMMTQMMWVRMQACLSDVSWVLHVKGTVKYQCHGNQAWKSMQHALYDTICQRFYGVSEWR